MEQQQDKKAWCVLSKEYLFNRPWLTATRCEMQLPNGNTIPEYYILEYNDWVNTIALDKFGNFIMISQYRPGIGRTCFELCAGVSEEGESPMESAKRELYEETGYGKGDWTLHMVVAPNPATQTNYTFCFLATNVEKISSQHLESTEDIEVHIMSASEVKLLLQNNEIMQALHVAPLWKYFAEHEVKCFA